MNEPRRRGFWFFLWLAIFSLSIPIVLVLGFMLAALLVDTGATVVEIPSTLSVATIPRSQTFVDQTFTISGDDGNAAGWAAIVLVPLAVGAFALVQVARRR